MNEQLTLFNSPKQDTVEGIILLRGIYAEKMDRKKFDYWDNILKEVDQHAVHTQPTWPDFFI